MLVACIEECFFFEMAEYSYYASEAEQADLDLALHLHQADLGPQKERAGAWETVSGKGALPSVKAQLKNAKKVQKGETHEQTQYPIRATNLSR